MASSTREKQNANLRKGNPEYAFNARTASEAGKKSVEVMKQKRAEAKIIKDELLKKMNEKDWDELISNALQRAKDDKGDFELLLSIIGQKPIDKQQIDVNANITLEDLLDSIDD